MIPQDLKIEIDLLCEGLLSGVQASTIEKQLLESPAAMEYYLSEVEIRQLLTAEHESQAYLKNPIIPIETILRRQRQNTWKIAAIAAVALITISLTALKLFQISQEPILASIESSADTTFQIDRESSSQGNYTDVKLGSRVTLSQGIINLTLPSGTNTIITAPAEFTLTNDNQIDLASGKAWFNVPKNATGFTVTTPDLAIVDLGTEFGVATSKLNISEVHVFKGSVDVTIKHRPKQTQRLNAGAAVKSTFESTLEFTPITDDQFLTSLPSPSDHTIIFQDEFNSNLTNWISKGSVNSFEGDFNLSNCKINTLGSNDHSTTHFAPDGLEISASGKSFISLGSHETDPTNSISTTFLVEASRTYTAYFRIAATDPNPQICHVSFSSSSIITESTIAASPSRWTSHSLTFTAQKSGTARLTLSDKGTPSTIGSDLLIDSVIISSQMAE